ncbi:hypothetical protein BC938DRAFT_482069 [Jimgerdemannia flammicorona]|uniref:Uncharacterized protein n=1 Tax=Jimgerdemannia flammicorona TaxID=994334 RepID=A0A433QEN1_9FUNG|nr:hypothetical protein BC938DRAFT_482069 [Jimgerdemannia flammicorona]
MGVGLAVWAHHAEHYLLHRSGVHGLLPPLPYPRQLRQVIPWREARDSGAAHYHCHQPRRVQGFALPPRSGHLPGPEHYFRTLRLYHWRPLESLASNPINLDWADGGRIAAGLGHRKLPQLPVHRVSKRRVVVTAALGPAPAPRADPRGRAVAVPLARDYGAN